MTVERFVADTRGALAGLLGSGGISAGSQTVARFRSLAAQARGLGLSEVGSLAETLAEQLSARGSFATAASQPLADTTLALFDRIEGLASTLALWSVEREFASAGVHS